MGDPNINKIIITGGAGFIGSQVAQAYLLAGYKVIIVDDFSMGKKENLPEGVLIYQVDICNFDELSEIFMREQPTIVNHHAALVSVRESYEHPEPYWRVNLRGTENVLQTACKAGVSKFIYASSGGAIYGEAQALPILESSPANPISPYGESKLAAEKLLRHHDGNPEIVILRYANVYGPGQDALQSNGVIAIFCHALLNAKQPRIFGDGSQTRDFIHVEDIVAANLAASKPGVGGIYNIGTGVGHSLLDVYLQIAKDLGVTTMPIFLPGHHYEVEHNVLDLSRAEASLGWQPRKPFGQGLLDLIQAMMEQRTEQYVSI